MLRKDAQILSPDKQSNSISKFSIGSDITTAVLDDDNVIQRLEGSTVRSIASQSAKDFISISHSKGNLLITLKQRVYDASNNEWVHAERITKSHKLYHSSGSVVELAYTADLKSAAQPGLWVRVPPELPF